MLKFDVIKNQKNRRINRPWRYFDSFFGAVWGERGVAEFKLRLQADFNSRFTRPTPQAGVRRMKIYAQMDPKSHPKINLWAIRGQTFEVFGNVWRNAIFHEFWDVQKVGPK